MGVGFPSQWVDVAIPYGRLKKCLKKVQKELGDLGLGPDTLSVLMEPGPGSPVLLNYKLDGTDSPGRSRSIARAESCLRS